MPYKVVKDAFRIDSSEDTLVYYEEPTPGPPGPKGDKGDQGDVQDAWPIHSVFFTDTELINPNTLLGFGTWSSLGKIPSLDAWGWKRTA